MSHEKDFLAIPKAMGAALFSGLKGQGVDGILDIPMAVMIPLVAAMLADGRVEQDELVEIQSICASSPIFERNSRGENEYLIARATKIIEDVGMGEGCQLAKMQLTPNLRETAFVHAVRVIFSDGHVGRLEREVIENMAGWLDIDPARARMMVEVVSVMQHPATA